MWLRCSVSLEITLLTWAEAWQLPRTYFQTAWQSAVYPEYRYKSVCVLKRSEQSSLLAVKRAPKQKPQILSAHNFWISELCYMDKFHTKARGRLQILPQIVQTTPPAVCVTPQFTAAATTLQMFHRGKTLAMHTVTMIVHK